MNIVTSNHGKFVEYREIFPCAKMLDIGYREIQADTLEEVVKDVLDELSEHAPLIIDDSGLFIDALEGFPGVYSAYVMDTIGCGGILKLMDGMEERSAIFECVIGYIGTAGKTGLIKGTVHGSITTSQRGDQGFGYDPIFVPDGYSKTFAEMPSSEKNRVSHRGIAMEKLKSNSELIL